ncbi:MAG TPA: hypothetical protein VFM46_18655 [Pseudomonadales bacterium]|nr:hypothetical protein [Pseudomonadales bacterium]
MDDFLAALAELTPECLTHFQTARTPLSFSEKSENSRHYVTRAIKCVCGNENLYLEAARKKELRGVCKKEEIISVVPPIYAGCKACKKFTLLFDPQLHGWRAQMQGEDMAEDDYRLMKCTPNPGRVYVAYSYPDERKIAELAMQGINNPQDYFDTFVVLFSDVGSENNKQILFAECGPAT